MRVIYRSALAAFGARKETGPERAIRKRLARLHDYFSGSSRSTCLLRTARGLPGWFQTGFRLVVAQPGVTDWGGEGDEKCLNSSAKRMLELPQDHGPDKDRPDW